MWFKMSIENWVLFFKRLRLLVILKEKDLWNEGNENLIGMI